MFFYIYAVIEFLAIFLDSGIIQTASAPYPVRVYLFRYYEWKGERRE